MKLKFDRTRLITPALLVAFILIWHFYVSLSGISRFIIPPPLEVWDALLDLLTTPSTLRHTWATLYETLLGFVRRHHHRRGSGHGARQDAVA